MNINAEHAQRPDPVHLHLPYSLELQRQQFLDLQEGMFAQISLDPTLSLRSLCDPAVDQISPTLPQSHFWIYIYQKSSQSIGSVPFYLLNFMFVSKGEPEYDEMEGIDPSLCVPILPSDIHPEGRPPANPSPAFPHQRFYIHTHTLYRVRIGCVNGDQKDAPTVSRSTAVRIASTHHADWARHTRAIAAARAAILDSPTVYTQSGSEADSESNVKETEELTEVNWEREMLDIREKASLVTEEFWNARSPVVRNLVEEWLMSTNPKDEGGIRAFRTVFQVYLNPADWSEPSNSDEFFSSYKRLQQVARASDRRWITRLRQLLDMPPYFEVSLIPTKAPEPETECDSGVIEGWLEGVQEADEHFCLGCGTICRPKISDDSRDAPERPQQLETRITEQGLVSHCRVNGGETYPAALRWIAHILNPWIYLLRFFLVKPPAS